MDWLRKGENRRVWVTVQVVPSTADISIRLTSLSPLCPSKVGRRPVGHQQTCSKLESASAQKGAPFLNLSAWRRCHLKFVYLSGLLCSLVWEHHHSCAIELLAHFLCLEFHFLILYTVTIWLTLPWILFCHLWSRIDSGQKQTKKNW